MFQRQSESGVSNPVIESGSLVALICNYKGKDVVRVKTRCRMYYRVNGKQVRSVGPAELVGRKANLNYRHAELGPVRIVQAGSLFSFIFFIGLPWWLRR